MHIHMYNNKNNLFIINKKSNFTPDQRLHLS